MLKGFNGNKVLEQGPPRLRWVRGAFVSVSVCVCVCLCVCVHVSKLVCLVSVVPCFHHVTIHLSALQHKCTCTRN
jgi:hypothetical protein